ELRTRISASTVPPFISLRIGSDTVWRTESVTDPCLPPRPETANLTGGRTEEKLRAEVERGVGNRKSTGSRTRSTNDPPHRRGVGNRKFRAAAPESAQARCRGQVSETANLGQPHRRWLPCPRCFWCRKPQI